MSEDPRGLNKRSRSWIPLCVAACLVFFIFLAIPTPGIRSSTLWKQNNNPNCAELRERYLTTLKKSITGYALRTRGMKVFGSGRFTTGKRERGLDWPEYGVSMIGLRRLENIRQAIDTVDRDGITGEFVELGVWRGGGSIFANAVTTTGGGAPRQIILVDSFSGLPPPSTNDSSKWWVKQTYLCVSLEEVRENFNMFDLLTANVKFVKGFFNESAPVLATYLASENKKIAVLRLDGDMFESTMDILYNLYEFVPVGGWIIVDDWTVDECQRAIKVFWENQHYGQVEVQKIDGVGAYWVKPREHDKVVDKTWYHEFQSKRQFIS